MFQYISNVLQIDFLGKNYINVIKFYNLISSKNTRCPDLVIKQCASILQIQIFIFWSFYYQENYCILILLFSTFFFFVFVFFFILFFYFRFRFCQLVSSSFLLVISLLSFSPFCCWLLFSPI